MAIDCTECKVHQALDHYGWTGFATHSLASVSQDARPPGQQRRPDIPDESVEVDVCESFSLGLVRGILTVCSATRRHALMSNTFPADAAHGIVTHMNDDHADAILAMVQVYGNLPEATSARMLSITADEMAIEAVEGNATRRLSVVFEPPVDPLDTVRARLVSMTRSARAVLAERLDSTVTPSR